MRKQSRRSATYLAAGLATAAWLIASPVAAQTNLEPVNLALGKPARQSSIYNGDPSQAVDGNSDGNFWNWSVIHTWDDPHSWWEVDLGAVRQIGRVEIANRTDCCGERLIPFMLIVADFPIIDADMTDTDAAIFPGVMRTTVTGLVQTNYSIPVNRSGRYVRIALVNQTHLHVAEVKVIEADNAARGRPATQSSTIAGGEASRAVDGNADGVFSSGSVSVTTANEGAPWWYVDLGMEHDIREIHVWGGNADCCWQYTPRPKFVVKLSKTPFTPANGTWSGLPAVGIADTYPKVTTGATTQVVPVDQAAPAVVPIDARGRYVAIQLTSADQLSLSEVQVWTVARGSVGAHAKLSSPAGGSTEDLAIDMNIGSGPATTLAQDQPYWEADLGGNRYLETVKLWGEPGDGSLSTHYLFVSNSEFRTSSGAPITQIGDLKTAPGVSWWLGRGATPVSATAIRRLGRYVRVVVPGINTLKLREVEIVATEGIAMATTTINNTTYNRNNASIVPFGTSEATLRTFTLSGYYPRPSTNVSVYGFVPNASGSGGTYQLFASGLTGSTPVLTGYSAAPLYGFVTVNAQWPLAIWPNVGIGNLLFQAADDSGFTMTPLRGIDNNGSEHAFWPDIRFINGRDAPVGSPYLTLPMGASTITPAVGYPSNLIPSTRTGFMNTYGYNTSSFHAKYYNAADLGLSRDMFCKTSYPWRTCMVDNWAREVSGSPGVPSFGNHATATGPEAQRMATVVMVASTTTPSNPPVFGAYDKNGNRLNEIKLDIPGRNKAIPNNCMACHGGSGAGFDASGKPKVNRAAFLPFDTESFLDWTPTVASQREPFRQLNAFVLASQPTPAIVDLITGWYGSASGVNNPNQFFNRAYVPAGWKKTPGQTKIYNEVIKPHCRTCHIAQENSQGGLDFLKASDVEALRALIVANTCVSYRMPHAEQTLKRFWADGSRAQLLGFFGRNDFGGACK